MATKKATGKAQGRRRGAPEGNKNALHNKGGAPRHNKNAEKDGAYSTITLDDLTDAEKRMIDQMPPDALGNLQQELKVLRVREKRIFDKILQYEDEDESTLHLSSLTDMRAPEGGKDGACQTMGMYSSETAFNRAMRLNEALYKVQGRIVAVLCAISAIEENEKRRELEHERLEIMRMRATGIIEFEDAELEAADIVDA